jgi:hypothetical protein
MNALQEEQQGMLNESQTLRIALRQKEAECKTNVIDAFSPQNQSMTLREFNRRMKE